MSFFKAYDMRGTFGVDFDLETVYKVGKALPQVVKGKHWLVGRDCRVTSKDVRDALVKGLEEAGAEVRDLGLCTTPMVYFFTAEEGFDGSVMITASHNPPSDNGLKVSMRTALPVGYANGLNEVERIVLTPSNPNAPLTFRKFKDGEALARFARTEGVGSPEGEARAAKRSPEAESSDSSELNRYLEWMKARRPDFGELRYAIDCSNGMASILVHELFPDAVIINDTPDGTFPNHSPNPLKAEAREQIAALVRERGLDCGLIFDGDADRCMFVDEKGDFVQPDYLIPIAARATLNSNTQTLKHSNNPKIIHDVRTSRGAIEELKRMGCEPVMVPVGHAFAKPILREIGAVCGGELAGHYYFSEFHGCDSGVLAALRILGEIANAKASGKAFSEMMKPIGGVYANSGEMNFKVEDKDAAIERVLATAAAKLTRAISRSEIDGIRIEYEEGWINIRKSNTEPYLRLIVECDTVERLKDWVAILKTAVEA